MRPCIVFLMFYFYSCYHGFLLDDRTHPPTKGNPVLSEGHYNLLFNLLADEKQSRLRLEETVQKLQNELLATQGGVTQNYHSIQKNNQTYKAHDSSLELLKSRFLQLQHDHDSLKLEFTQLKLNHTALQSHSTRLEQELSSIKQLQGVANLQEVMNIQNKTDHLEEKIKSTNNRLDRVANDVDARKQDFFALYHKADQTQTELMNSTSRIKGKLSVIEGRQTQIETSLLGQMATLKTNMETTIQSQVEIIEKKQNSTTDYFKSEFHKMSNRVAVTAWANYGYYLSGSVVRFSTIHTSHGTNGSETANMGLTGKFTCQRSGLYLVSVFILTNVDGAVVYTYKNSETIAYTDFATPGLSQTNEITVLERLTVGDTIYITTGRNMYIWGDQHSSITILQITDD